jgi:HSP20 family molecular chaperone IbpA
MLMPSIFGTNMFNDFMEPFDNEFMTNGLMSTDVKDNDNNYEIAIDLPGVKKEDVKAQLKDGYLNIEASSSSNKDEKDEKGNYIRRERYTGKARRSFYVGNEVTQEEIKAKFEDGTLTLLVPKKEDKPEVEQKQNILIED